MALPPVLAGKLRNPLATVSWGRLRYSSDRPQRSASVVWDLVIAERLTTHASAAISAPADERTRHGLPMAGSLGDARDPAQASHPHRGARGNAGSRLLTRAGTSRSVMPSQNFEGALHRHGAGTCVKRAWVGSGDEFRCLYLLEALDMTPATALWALAAGYGAPTSSRRHLTGRRPPSPTTDRPSRDRPGKHVVSPFPPCPSESSLAHLADLATPDPVALRPAPAIYGSDLPGKGRALDRPESARRAVLVPCCHNRSATQRSSTRRACSNRPKYAPAKDQERVRSEPLVRPRAPALGCISASGRACRLAIPSLA